MYRITIESISKKNIWTWYIRDNDDNDKAIAEGKWVEGKNTKKECLKRAIKAGNALTLEVYEKNKDEFILIE